MAPHTWSRPKRHTPRALPGLNCSRRCSLPWKGVLTSQPFISDGPMPDYVSSIQTRSKEGESQTVTTQVRATISTYNNTTEIFRDHSSWWDQYIEFDSGIIITTIDLYTNGVLGSQSTTSMSNPGDKSSWFLAIAPSWPGSPPI